jgi:hypothetical protein
MIDSKRNNAWRLNIFESIEKTVEQNDSTGSWGLILKYAMPTCLLKLVIRRTSVF